MKVLGVEIHRATSPGDHLRWLLDLTRPELTIDVGANKGQFIRELRNGGFSGPVVAIEPNPALADHLAIPDVRVHALAAGEAEGELDLTVFRDSSLASLHPVVADLADSMWPDTGGAQVEDRVRVPVRRLDKVVSDLPDRVFLKVDTQGHDMPAIRGAAGFLDRVVLLQSELPFQALYEGVAPVAEHLAELTRLGFTLAALHPITRTTNGALVEADGLFVRS